MDHIVPAMLTFRNQIKLYHWKTSSYARHKATDEFLELFDQKVDKFVETMLGGRDIKIKDKFKIDFVVTSDKTITDYVNEFKHYLVEELPQYLLETETDLLNLRDEILNDINQMLYLFRLS